MVSVITPIYNVSKFIDRGVQNVLAQSYIDYELILSDDGSSDSSRDICNKWAERDSRIKVIHQENKGAGSARNHALEEAKGEYVYFFDIDDEIDTHLLSYCVQTMDEKNVDFICFGYNNVETSYNSKVSVVFPEKVISSNQELKNSFVDQFVLKVNGFLWNKFYRKTFLDRNNIRFEDQRIQQDEVFNLMCYKHLERAYLSPKTLYTYYVYDKGNTRSRFIPDRFDVYKSVRFHFDELTSFWSLNDKRLNDFLDKRFYTSVLQCVFFNLTHRDCSWTRSEKETELDRIMDDALTFQSFKYANTHETGIKDKLLRKACQRKSLSLITFYAYMFSFLSKTRKQLA